MRNKVCKAIKCELRHSVFKTKLSLKQKFTNEVSGFEASTQYERLCKTIMKKQRAVGLNSISDRFKSQAKSITKHIQTKKKINKP